MALPGDPPRTASREPLPADAVRVLKEWFGDPVGWPSKDFVSRWWKKDAAFDEHLREAYGDLLIAAKRGELDEWARWPSAAVARVVVLDQFSRNIHRGTPGAFEADPRAVAAARDVLAAGFLPSLEPWEQYFLGMPFMHSEDVLMQREGQQYFRTIVAEAPPIAEGPLKAAVEFMDKHAVIVERFGRFPHRNAILGRSSTTEEAAFLLEPGSSF